MLFSYGGQWRTRPRLMQKRKATAFVQWLSSLVESGGLEPSTFRV